MWGQSGALRLLVRSTGASQQGTGTAPTEFTVNAGKYSIGPTSNMVLGLFSSFPGSAVGSLGEKCMVLVEQQEQLSWF